MRNITVLTLCWWLVTMACVAQTADKLAHAKSAPNHVDVQYQFQEGSVTLNEPVVLLLWVHNGLTQPVTLTLGARKTQFFQFSLKTPEGRTLQNTRNPADNVSIVTFGSGKATVDPGGEYQQPILMNQWFRFETVGTYVLTAQLTAGMEIPDSAGLAPQSQTARLEVKPRDPARLEKVCAVLTRQVEDTLSVEEWQFPARALSSVDDPIAVPYLGRVLATHKGTESIVIPALERIGNDDAISVLLSVLGDKSGDIAELARQSLTRMQGRIMNPSLSEAVRQALMSKAE